MVDIKSKAAEQGKDSAEEVKDDNVEEPTRVEQTSKTELKEKILQSKTSISSTTEEDLDVFLLGDPGDSDDGGSGVSKILLTSYICSYGVHNRRLDVSYF